LLSTSQGDIQAIVHHNQTTSTTKGIVWVGWTKGRFDGPSEGIYRDLSETHFCGIKSNRVNYREPDLFHESVLDTLAGVSFLVATSHTDILWAGHSFDGAVVISAAPFSENVKGVIALSSQIFGPQNVGNLSPRSLRLVHGEEDTRLPPECSQQIYNWLQIPKN